MKIAFVGSCQVHGMANSARRLLPDAEIVSLQQNAPYDNAEIERRIRGFEIGVSQFRDMPGQDDRPSPRSLAAMCPTMRDAVFVPTVVFTGFHPDVVYLSGTAGLIPGPYGEYHSQLAILSYLSGMRIESTLALYNAHIFSEMGYFKSYGLAKDKMLRQFSSRGYDLSTIIGGWETRRFVFMHTINHPNIVFLSELTKLVLVRLGLIDPQAVTPNDIPDGLANVLTIPVYPPLAKRLNVEGSTTILRDRGEVGPGAERALALPEYIARSFAIYRERDRDDLQAAVAQPALARFQELLA